MDRLVKSILIGIWFISTSVLAQAIYGPTQAKEDLWHVASHYQAIHPQTTVQQWMLAIFRANSMTFQHSNMNGMMAGYTLKVPSLLFVQTIAPETANYVLARHNQAWRQGGEALMSHAASWPFTHSSDVQAHLAALNKRIISLSHAFEAMQQQINGQYADLSGETAQMHQQMMKIM